MGRTAVWGATAAVVCLTMTGCGMITITRPGIETDPVAAKLATLKNSKQTVPLSSVTDFGWDEVHHFRESTPRHRVEDVVGGEVIHGSEVTAGGLLVFERSGQVVRKVYVRGDYLRADHPSWTTQVVLVPASGGIVSLSEPN